MTESVLVGFLWSVGFIVFGSGISCLYLAYRIAWHRALGLASTAVDVSTEEFDEESHEGSKEDGGAARLKELIAALYGLAGLAFTGALMWMLVNVPLFPLQSDSAGWLTSWLAFSVVDYELSA